MSFERAVGARRPGKKFFVASSAIRKQRRTPAPRFNVAVPASPRLRTMKGERVMEVLVGFCIKRHTVARCIRVPNRLFHRAR